MPGYLDLLAHFGVGGAHPGGFMLTKEIIELEMIPESSSILDAGCGTGQTMQFLKSLNYDVTGLDIDPIMLLKAKNRLKEDTCLVQGSLEKLPFEDNQFDFIFCESVLSFTNSAESLRELNRVLKDNGVLISIEVTRADQPDRKLIEKIQSFYGFHHLFNEQEWKSAFKTAGFQKVEVRTEHDYIIEEDEPTTEFDMSENLDSVYFDMLAEHEKLREGYHQAVQFRIFRCMK
ncbi:class I SAM-dependent methyltransferase [Metabacillus idriensis]|uniref:class I SAM-dependent methyltransferase n=1 Tax=Metabacillus idriensis TaxID=324768 RepID=UPI002812D1E7|nr:class I SAM-dependent methyltransferase [Metabacillus idriensis]MDR0137722.1 class I SAM-dependent methyltransferase [Metabacillus idriensis]